MTTPPSPPNGDGKLLLELARAKRVGTNDFRKNLVDYLELDEMVVLTIYGQPKMVAIPYEMALSIFSRAPQEEKPQ